MSTKKLQVIGLKGKSAYQYAQDGGYTGSETEFKEKMATELEVSYDYNDLNEKILATAIKPEVSGTGLIHVEDSSTLPIIDFGMEGKTEQDVSNAECINLINLPEETVTWSGQPNESHRYKITDLCPMIKAGDKIVFSTKNGDSMMLFGGWAKEEGKVFEVSEPMIAANYIGIYGKTGVSEDNPLIVSEIMINKGDEVKPYVPYIDPSALPTPDHPAEIVNAGVHNEATGRYEVECELSSEDNLFNKNTVVSGMLNEFGVVIADDSYYSSDFIPVSQGKSYYSTPTGSVRTKYYNSNKTPISTASVSDVSLSNGGVFTIPNGVSFIRTTILTDKLDTTMISPGTTESPYVPHVSHPLTLTSPVPLTKWDKLVKRDGVWGWSIWSKNKQVKSSEQGNSWSGFYDKTPEGIYTYQISIVGKALGSKYNTPVNIFCTTYRSIFGAYGADAVVNTIAGITSGTRIFVNTDIPTLDEWKTHLDENPLDIWYQTAEEQSFHPLPDEEQKLLKSLETYYGVTNITNDQNLPMTLTYIADPNIYISNLEAQVANEVNALSTAVVALGGEV